MGELIVDSIERYKPKETIECMWKAVGFKPIVHRLVWWLLDVGAAGNVLQHGWQNACARDINVHRITVYRQTQLLIDSGVLIDTGRKGEITINPDVFARCASSHLVKKVKVKQDG